MRSLRKNLSSEYVHVTQRGLGRRLIFEDDSDRRKYLFILKNKLKDTDGIILSWCLMSNHVHLLTRMKQPALSKLMQRVGISYAQYFNGRHGHVGKVFQGRFFSAPIEDEKHLLSTIRYIHKNPEAAEICLQQDYPWSSYREITGNDGHLEGEGICNVSKVMTFFGGVNEFERFHSIPGDDASHDTVITLREASRISDAHAQSIAAHHFGCHFSDNIASMSKMDRDSAIRILKSSGLSGRQIERLTGIGRGIIERA